MKHEQNRQNPQQSVEHLFRHKHAEILAAILRSVGFENMELVEEAIQGAFQKALEHWPYAGMPENPGGWLYTVARNRTIDALRKRKRDRRRESAGAADMHLAGADCDPSDLPDELSTGLDDLATMILLCCNPAISPIGQVCVTLRAACGFSVLEIARVLGMRPEAVKKTLTRSRKRIATERRSLKVLAPGRVSERFWIVMQCLYAMFTEGYAASSGPSPMRREVAEEAIRLADILLAASIVPESEKADLHALVALMLFQLARFDARCDALGTPIRIEDQDRTLWNRDLIHAGLTALAHSQRAPRISAYHLEARIAAEHATSPDFSRTDWTLILRLYDDLLKLKPDRAVQLNRIVALGRARGPDEALEQMARLEPPDGSPARDRYLYHAARGDLLLAAGRPGAGQREWSLAAGFAPTKAEQAHAQKKSGPAPEPVPNSDRPAS